MKEKKSLHGIQSLYASQPALLTDLYELTMAYGYWKSGTDNKEAVFTLFFRDNPFGGGYSIACGLGYVVNYLKRFRFETSDIGYLSGLRVGDGSPLFETGFLDYLGSMEFSCDVDAMPEGTAVFPLEPMLRITGPIVQCQVLETALLNMMNFQTLIATKAARVCLAALGDPVLEFGLRRAQGFDGGVAASRASYIGGCAGTSNVLAGKLFDIPVKGTHAHSWVMSFDSELESFMEYAEAMPDNCIFLVDTYDTIEGIKNAIEAGAWLRGHGHEMIGIRLDSGDMGRLSIEARRMLDNAGFDRAVIVASNELDEYAIERFKRDGASIHVWGVGTKLATGYDQPALGGVYKLVAVRPPDGEWDYKVKLSDDPAKSTIPGILQVRRFAGGDGVFLCDVIYDSQLGAPETGCGMHRIGSGEIEPVPASETTTDLLVPVFRGGKSVYNVPNVHEARTLTLDQLSHLPEQVKQLSGPSRYPVGIDARLHDMRASLMKRHDRR